MATSNLTTGTLANNIAQFWDKELLERLEGETLTYQFGDKRPIPSGDGKIIHWTRYNNLNASDVGAISESTTPSEAEISSVKVSATIAQYGVHVIYTDVFKWTAIDKGTKEQVRLLAYAANKKVEDLILTELKNFDKQRVAGLANISLISAGNVLTINELHKAYRTLRNISVPGNAKAGGRYVAMLHPFCTYDLKANASAGSWTDVLKYSGDKRLETSRMGDIAGFRIYENEFIQVDASGVSDANVYNNIIFGNNSFGVVELSGRQKNPYMHITDLGSAGADDPYAQRGSIAAMVWMTQKVFDSTRGLVLQTGATQ